MCTKPSVTGGGLFVCIMPECIFTVFVTLYIYCFFTCSLFFVCVVCLFCVCVCVCVCVCLCVFSIHTCMYLHFIRIYNMKIVGYVFIPHFSPLPGVGFLLFVKSLIVFGRAKRAESSLQD